MEVGKSASGSLPESGALECENKRQFAVVALAA